MAASRYKYYHNVTYEKGFSVARIIAKSREYGYWKAIELLEWEGRVVDASETAALLAEYPVIGEGIKHLMGKFRRTYDMSRYSDNELAQLIAFGKDAVKAAIAADGLDDYFIRNLQPFDLYAMIA